METSFSYRSNVQEIPQIRKDLSALASSWKIPEPEIRQVKIIVEELFSNIVRFAYSDSAVHLIKLQISLANASITIRIVDDGDAFDPTVYKPSEEPDPVTSASGGMGLVLVKTFSDSIIYARKGQKNHLEITKNIRSNLES